MIKCFIIDLDGTLLQSNNSVKTEDAEYIINLQKRGFKVIIATGRNWKDTKEIAAQLKLSENKGAIVLSDGQHLVDFYDNSLLNFEYMNYSKDIKNIFSLFKRQKITVNVFSAEKIFTVFENPFGMLFLKSLAHNLLHKKALLNGIVFKNSKIEINGIEKITVKPFNKENAFKFENEEYDISFVHDKMRYEFKKKGVNKLSAALKLLDKYDISVNETVVFGNDENDICLFEKFANSYAVNPTSKRIIESKVSIIKEKNDLNGEVVLKIKNILEEDE